MVDKDSSTRKKYHKNVVETWSTQKYKKYKNKPFRDYITKGKLHEKEYLNQTILNKVENKSILEVGSAMGCL